MKRFSLFKCSVFSVSIVALAGCSSDRGSSPSYYSSTTTYPSGTYTATDTGGAVLAETDSGEPIAKRRVDITDSGPGTPRGDSSSGDPSETSSQGAGSRALVGEQSTRQPYTTSGETSVRTTDTRISTESSTPRTSYADTTPARETAETKSTVIPLYEEQVRVGKREVDAGTITIRKRVETETVNRPVELRRETISIDRQPASGGSESRSNLAENQQTAAQPFSDQEITIRLRREEPVIEKETVPAGQIVAQTQVQTRTTNIQSQVRRENVSVDRGNAQNVQISGNLASESGAGGTADKQSFSTGTGSSQQQAITELSMLRNVENPSAFVGRHVQFNNARVRAVVDQHLIALGDMEGQPVYVRLPQPIEGLQEGDTISLTGTIKQPEEAAGGAELEGDAAHVFGVQEFFVEAQSARKSQ